MPDRYLREAILRSERIGSLTMSGVVLYYKLLSLVDDYGCYDGREHVLASMSGWRFALPLPLRELQEYALIVRYLNGDKPFIALTQWGEARRGRRKWPAPPINTDIIGLDYQVPFNQAPNWKNPLGSDRVSILLDLDGHPADPQPREWRRVSSDWMPVGATTTMKVHERKEKTKHTAQATGAVASPSALAQDTVTGSTKAAPLLPGPVHGASTPSVSSSSSVSLSTSLSASSLPTPPSSAPAAPSPTRPLAQEPAPAAAPTTTINGKIRLTDDGQWDGLSEAQRLRWQGMFADLSIPDQLDRAGAWLLAHGEERSAYERDGEQEQFLIRWLLREAKSH